MQGRSWEWGWEEDGVGRLEKQGTMTDPRQKWEQFTVSSGKKGQPFSSAAEKSVAAHQVEFTRRLRQCLREDGSRKNYTGTLEKDWFMGGSLAQRFSQWQKKLFICSGRVVQREFVLCGQQVARKVFVRERVMWLVTCIRALDENFGLQVACFAGAVGGEVVVVFDIVREATGTEGRVLA